MRNWWLTVTNEHTITHVITFMCGRIVAFFIVALSYKLAVCEKTTEMDLTGQDFREENEKYGKQFQRPKTKRASWISGLSWAVPIYVAMVVCYAAYMFIKSRCI